MNSSCHICFFCLVVLVIIPGTVYGMQSSGPSKFKFQNDNNRSTSETTEIIRALKIHRKLFFAGKCAGRDISISQGTESTQGIPNFVVQITNNCYSGCPPRKIHLHCGWFASTRQVNPLTFRRLSYDDCLVNGGKPLEAGQIIRFTYSNSFMYPLSFRSAKFCHD